MKTLYIIIASWFTPAEKPPESAKASIEDSKSGMSKVCLCPVPWDILDRHEPTVLFIFPPPISPPKVTDVNPR